MNLKSSGVISLLDPRGAPMAESASTKGHTNMTTTMTPEFKEAKLYTCTDGEYITNSDWCEAILEELERDWETDESVEDQCKRTGPIKVTAYNSGEISPSWIKDQVEMLMGKFHEVFSEEYGCDEYAAEPWTKDTEAWTKSVLTSNLTKSLRSAETHTVKEVGTHTFSVEECIEMMQ